MSTDAQQRVYDLLQRMPSDGLAAAKQLFWTELNYDRAVEPLSCRGWPDRARAVLDDTPTALARHESAFGSFDVVYARLSEEQRGRTFPLSLTAERLAINQLLRDHPYALFLFSDPAERHWHLVNVKLDKASSQVRGTLSEATVPRTSHSNSRYMVVRSALSFRESLKSGELW